MSEAVLNMEEAERDRPKPKEPPRLLIGMSDVRVKIGTDIQFYAKGRLRLVLGRSDFEESWINYLNQPTNVQLKELILGQELILICRVYTGVWAKKGKYKSLEKSRF